MGVKVFLNNSFKHCNNLFRRKGLQNAGNFQITKYAITGKFVRVRPVRQALADPSDFWVPLSKVVRNKLQK